MQRLVHSLRAKPCAIDGFLTEEFLEAEQRMGFWLSPLDGRQVLLAHRRFEQGVRVGPYRVNVEVLDRVAVAVIERAIRQAFVLFLDELGKMELCSARFAQAVQDAFDRGPCIVATAGLAPLPLIAKLKQRRDVELIPLSAANRAVVEEELTARLAALCAEDDAVKRLQPGTPPAYSGGWYLRQGLVFENVLPLPQARSSSRGARLQRKYDSN